MGGQENVQPGSKPRCRGCPWKARLLGTYLELPRAGKGPTLSHGSHGPQDLAPSSRQPRPLPPAFHWCQSPDLLQNGAGTASNFNVFNAQKRR